MVEQGLTGTLPEPWMQAWYPQAWCPQAWYPQARLGTCGKDPTLALTGPFSWALSLSSCGQELKEDSCASFLDQEKWAPIKRPLKRGHSLWLPWV